MIFFSFTYLINEFCLNLNTLQNELKWIIRLNEIRSYKNIISVTFVPKARIQIFLLEFSEKISQSLRLFWLEGRQPLKFIALFTQYHLSFFPMKLSDYDFSFEKYNFWPKFRLKKSNNHSLRETSGFKNSENLEKKFFDFITSVINFLKLLNRDHDCIKLFFFKLWILVFKSEIRSEKKCSTQIIKYRSTHKHT